MEGLHSLAELKLDFPQPNLLLDAQLPPLDGLRKLTMALACTSTSVCYQLQSLAAAAAQGVSVTVDVCLQCCSALTRQRLWAALVTLPQLAELGVYGLHEGSGPAEPMSDVEQQLVAALSCDHLVLQAYIGQSTWAQQLLHILRYDTVSSCLRIVSTRLQWDCLTTRPGLHQLDVVRDLTLLGSPAALPAFAQGWAVVARHRTYCVIYGEATQLARSGPDGDLVWCNAAAMDEDLEGMLS